MCGPGVNLGVSLGAGHCVGLSDVLITRRHALYLACAGVDLKPDSHIPLQTVSFPS